MATDNRQPKNSPETTDNTARPERKGITRRVIGSLNPNVDLKNDFKPVNQTFQLFVQILASLFLANGMLTPDHRFFRPDANFTVGDLFHETFARVEWRNKARLPQTVFFCAVWGLLASMLLYLVTFVLLFVAAPSHAYAATTATSSNSMFSVPDTDLAKQFLHNLVMGEPVTAINAEGGQESFANTGLIQSAFRAMLSFYSRAILVLASFMLLYHIIMLMVNSAWSGKPLEGANQIWGPLRLVIAIGLLIPLSNGLNSGQHIVLKIADMGSALGTNAWHIFLDKLTASAATVQVPKNEKIKEEYLKMILVYACQEDVNNQLLKANGDNSALAAASSEYIKAVETTNADLRTVKFVKNWNAAGAMSGGFIECGKIELPQKVTTTATGALSSTYVNATGNKQISYDVSNILADAAEPLRKSAELYGTQLADKLTDYNDGENVDLSNVEPVLKGIADALQKYHDDSKTNITKAIANNQSWDYLKKSSWIMAGAYFMQLSSYQHAIYSAAQTMPKATLGPVFGRQPAPGEGLHSALNAVSAFFNPGNAKYATAHEDHFVQMKPIYTETLSHLLYDADSNQATDSAIKAVTDKSQASFSLASLLGFGFGKETIINIFKSGIEDPFASFVQAGNLFLMTGVGAVVLSIGSIVLAGVAGTVMGPFGAAAATTVVGLAQWTIAMSFYLILIGVLLGFLLPFVPVTKFLGGVTSWMLAVVEAVIGMPLFALAHLTPGGNGLLDPAIKGYHMLLHIALKPILMIFGMIAAMIIITLTLFGLNMMFLPAIDAVWGPGDVHLLVAIILFSIWGFSAYQITKASFGYLDHVSHKTMAWLGAGGYGFERLKGEDHAFASYQAIRTGADVTKDLSSGIAKTAMSRIEKANKKRAGDPNQSIIDAIDRNGGTGSGNDGSPNKPNGTKGKKKPNSLDTVVKGTQLWAKDIGDKAGSAVGGAVSDALFGKRSPDLQSYLSKKKDHNDNVRERMMGANNLADYNEAKKELNRPEWTDSNGNKTNDIPDGGTNFMDRGHGGLLGKGGLMTKTVPDLAVKHTKNAVEAMRAGFNNRRNGGGGSGGASGGGSGTAAGLAMAAMIGGGSVLAGGAPQTAKADVMTSNPPAATSTQATPSVGGRNAANSASVSTPATSGMNNPPRPSGNSGAFAAGVNPNSSGAAAFSGSDTAGAQGGSEGDSRFGSASMSQGGSGDTAANYAAETPVAGGGSSGGDAGVGASGAEATPSVGFNAPADAGSSAGGDMVSASDTASVADAGATGGLAAGEAAVAPAAASQATAPVASNPPPEVPVQRSAVSGERPPVAGPAPILSQQTPTNPNQGAPTLTVGAPPVSSQPAAAPQGRGPAPEVQGRPQGPQTQGRDVKPGPQGRNESKDK